FSVHTCVRHDHPLCSICVEPFPFIPPRLMSAYRAELNPWILRANQHEKPPPKEEIIPTLLAQYVKHLPGELGELGSHGVEPMQHNRQPTVCRYLDVPTL